MTIQEIATKHKCSVHTNAGGAVAIMAHYYGPDGNMIFRNVPNHGRYFTRQKWERSTDAEILAMIS